MTSRYETARSGGNSSFGNEKRPNDIQGDKGADARKAGKSQDSSARTGDRDDENGFEDLFTEQGDKKPGGRN